MRFPLLIVLAMSLAACSESDKRQAQQDAERAREKARVAAAQLKQESQQAYHEARADAREAGRQLNEDFQKAREKTKRGLDEPNRPDRTDRNNAPSR
jgi:cytochrome c biogenesis protein ResB